jgi:tellurite resistance protein
VNAQFDVVAADDFDEPAHVGAAKMMGQVDGHGDLCDGVLDVAVAVENADGIGEVADAYLIDGDIAKVAFVLDVA